jgi:dTDP-4-dehydrorhamnose 3,5-epimerase
MRVSDTALPGVLLVEPSVFGDERGFFLETYQAERYEAAGIPGPFVQDNVSRSRRGVLRGLHYQQPDAQGKLVQVLDGEVYDVAVDVRWGSPTFGRWTGLLLSSTTKQQLYIPAGFAHGFVVMSDHALFVYKCTTVYREEHDRSVLWSDPALGITWPVDDVQLSAKDRAAPTLGSLPPHLLPRYLP